MTKQSIKESNKNSNKENKNNIDCHANARNDDEASYAKSRNDKNL